LNFGQVLRITAESQHHKSEQGAAGGVEPKAEIASDEDLSEISKIPVMTFLIEKRINTELFIESNKWLYIQKGNKERINKISDPLEEGETEMAGK